MMSSKGKYKDVPTSELLDFINQDISYEETEKVQKRHDYQDELETRRPFCHMKRKIEDMQKEINELNEIVDKLLIHQHGEDDRPTVPVRKLFNRRVYC